MTSDEKNLFRIELGAKAEARLEIKAVVPEESTGRLVDALTDLIRPLSEARGLKADNIRLQREEVATRIAVLARQRAIAEGLTLVPPPLKILIPLLERASQEEVGDDFIASIWANLLASACSEESIPPRFISLVGEINSRQAQLFLSVLEKKSPIEEIELHKMQEGILGSEINDYLSNPELSSKQLFDLLRPRFDIAGVALGDIFIGDEDEFRSVPVDDGKYGTDAEDFDLQMLSSLGLFQYVNLWRHPPAQKVHLVNVQYYLVTRLGLEFYRAVAGRSGESV